MGQAELDRRIDHVEFPTTSMKDTNQGSGGA
jgi:hypothetical protein